MKDELPSAKYLVRNIVFIYAFFSSGWILFSDQLLGLLTSNSQQLTELQTLKGWLFSLITSGLLYALVRWGLQSLQTSSNLLQTVIEGTTDAVFVKDYSGRYMLVNTAVTKLLGKHKSQVIGKDDTALFSLETAETLTENDRRILTTGQAEVVEEIINIDGITRTYLSTKNVYRNLKKEIIGLIGIARDITERQQLLEELRREKEDLSAMLSVTANSISTLNLEELLQVLLGRVKDVMQADAAVILLKKGNHLCVRASIGIEDVTHSTYSLPIGQGFAGIIAATRQPLYIEDAQTDSRVMSSLIKQCSIRTMLGVPLVRDSNFVGVLHVDWLRVHPESDRELHLLEITAERCTMAILNAELYEQTLRLQQRLQLQIDCMPIGCIVNDAQFRLTDWNLAAEKIFGFTKQEVLGKDPCELITPPEVYTHVKGIFQRLAAGEVTVCSINENLTKDGRTIICEWHNTALKAADGTMIGMLSMAQDITERRATEIALRDSEQRYRMLFESNPHPMWVYDVETLAFLAVNDAAIDHYGYSREEFLSMTIRDIRPPEDVPALLAKVSQKTPAFNRAGQWRHRKQDGTIIDVEITSHRLVFAGRRAEVVLINDISDRKHTEAQLRHYAFYDSLTGLPNRALLLEQIAQQIEIAKRGEPVLFAVLLLELEHLEMVKHSLGHAAADQLMTATAERVETYLEPTQTLARIGASELAILLTDIGHRNEAIRTADRIRQLLLSPFDMNGREVFSTINIGIALGGSVGLDNPDSSPPITNTLLPIEPISCPDHPEDFLRAADTARHHAKLQAPVNHAVFNSTMHEQALQRFQMETDLRRAIERQQLQVYYQPIVSLEDGRITGFEALVRWLHPTRGMVPPVEFIPLAEETGIISLIDWWVLREACTQLGIWQPKFAAKTSLTMSVNLSGLQLSQLGLLQRLDQILQETGVEGQKLKLEITESGLLKNAPCGTVILQQLKTLGVKLSIDDFGTGYSSLARLHQLPIDTLKIDRSFVNQMSNDSESLEIVRAIMTLAHTLEMDVIAEGVETPEQLAKLRSLNCEYGQGYFFSKPVDSHAAEQLLAAQLQW